MKKIFTLLFLCLCTALLAQPKDTISENLDRLYKKARYLYKKGCPESDQAYKDFEKVILLYQEQQPRYYARYLDLKAATSMKGRDIVDNVRKARAIRAQYLPATDQDHVASLLNELHIFISMKSMDSSRAYVSMLENAIPNVTNLDSTYYAMYLVKKALVYETFDAKYGEAYNLRLKALSIQGSRDTMDYCDNLGDMAVNRFLSGEWSLADSLYLRAIGLQKQVVCDNKLPNKKITSTFINYLNFLSKIGNYEKAQLYYDANLSLIKGREERYNIIGNILIGLKQYKSAIDTLGYAARASNPSIQLNGKVNLAKAYLQQQKAEDFQRAKSLLLEANQVKVDPLTRAAIAQNLGICYHYEGVYDTAKQYLEQALQYRMSNKAGSDYIDVLQVLGLNYSKTGNIPMADSLMLLANNELLKFIQSSLDYMTMDEAAHLAAKYKTRFDAFFRYVNEMYDPKKPAFPVAAYNSAMVLKGLTVTNNRLKYTQLPPEMDSVYKELLETRRSIIKGEQKESSVSDANITDLRLHRDSLEKVLQKVMKTDWHKFHSWETLQQALLPNELAIEFLKFAGDRDTTIWYYALLVQKGMTAPVMIKLCKESDLKASMKSKDIQRRYAMIYMPKEFPYRSNYELILKPLEKYIKQSAYVFYAPVGELNKINLAALSPEQGKLLTNKFTRLWSTSSILDNDFRKSKIETPKSASLFDRIDYGDVLTVANSFAALQYQSDDSLLLFLRSNKIRVNKITGSAATEQRFYKEADSSDLLMLYTHGEYLLPVYSKNGRREIFVQHHNKLSRSLMAMANANKYLDNDYLLTRDTAGDGLMTAYEITEHNFYKIPLITLIGCESAIGYELAYEGMFGFPRAFKMAGTRFVLAALDEVPAEAAREYHLVFFRQLVEANWDVRAAFDITRQHFYQKYPEDPYKWAGFMLFE